MFYFSKLDIPVSTG
jgi:hypothetical protein